jgi:hypothetical protein
MRQPSLKVLQILLGVIFPPTKTFEDSWKFEKLVGVPEQKTFEH